MLTWAERLILWNQYEMQKVLAPEREDECNEAQEILASGYEQFYWMLNQSISDKPVPIEETQEVMDILDMYRAINFSSKKAGYSSRNPWAEFGGFDGNAASNHFGIATFLRRTQGKWAELEDLPDNSHNAASLDRYRSMLDVWKQMGKKSDLSTDELESILDLKGVARVASPTS